MKKRNTLLSLSLLGICTLALAGCEKHETHTWGEWERTVEPTELQPGKEVAKCTYKGCDKQKERDVPALGFPFNVTFKNADGSVLKTEVVRSIKNVEKPADPTAPAGQVFYGWKNVKNGGQIWNFDDEVLAKPHADLELVPCFIPAGTNAKVLEAEFAPDIVANGGMDGATYSGANKGKGLIIADDDYEYGSTCEIEPFKYYVDSDTRQEIVTETAPEGVTLKTMDPKGSNKGYFVHFNYINGNTLTFTVNSSADVDDAVIFGRFSAEYGKVDQTTSDRYMTFTSTSYPITVNGTALDYGTITMHDIPETGKFLPFQDYLLGVNVHLNAGENTIIMKVDNHDELFSAIKCTAPCSDSLKIYTSATLDWTNASVTNIIK